MLKWQTMRLLIICSQKSLIIWHPETEGQARLRPSMTKCSKPNKTMKMNSIKTKKKGSITLGNKHNQSLILWKRHKNKRKGLLKSTIIRFLRLRMNGISPRPEWMLTLPTLTWRLSLRHCKMLLKSSLTIRRNSQDLMKSLKMQELMLKRKES